ncbi:uncharacterized protein LOC124249950 [Equus quagga]|uniref:uncharacterized protein LOC124249950 n=1 Tax=Equus quagga TaxID=89248 RepID=UPI001EE30D57|nr:uncharacterized protein LOC124249950 [Equus quagga]
MSETPRQLGRPPSQRRSSPSRPAQRPAAGGLQRAPPAHGHARRACKFPARPEDVLWAPRVRLRGQRQRHSGWLSILQPFGCVACGRAFKGSRHLAHSGARLPHACPLCPRQLADPACASLPLWVHALHWGAAAGPRFPPLRRGSVRLSALCSGCHQDRAAAAPWASTSPSARWEMPPFSISVSGNVWPSLSLSLPICWAGDHGCTTSEPMAGHWTSVSPFAPPTERSLPSSLPCRAGGCQRDGPVGTGPTRLRPFPVRLRAKT